MLRVGCCGFPVGIARYARELGVSEVQKTFYRIPRLEIVRRWRERVPAGFIFTVKAWQGITHPASSPTYRRSGPALTGEMKRHLGHFRPTEPVFRGWDETVEVARILGSPVILLQAPPSFDETREHEENLAAFLAGIRKPDARIALEFRSSWNREKIGAFCREYGLIHCTDPFRENPATGPPFYLRLHGSPPGKKMYSYRYTAEDLLRLRDWVASLDREGEGYCLFNNLSMWDDALAFRDILRGA